MPTATQERIAALRAFTAGIRQQLDAIEQKIQVDIFRLDGSTRRIDLKHAKDRYAIAPDDLRAGAQAIIFDAILADHDRQSLAKYRAEPETLSEWFGALASGRLAVAFFSATGALASRLLLLALIVGLIGFGARVSGIPTLIDQAQLVELSLLGVRADDAVSQAQPNTPTLPHQPDCQANPSDCTDDEHTISALQTVFRSGAIRAIERQMALQARTSPQEIRREAFQVAAIDTRRGILSETRRPAAAPLDPGAPAMQYDASVHPPTKSAEGAAFLDQAFKRRVDELRRHESTWDRLRFWAAHPVSADTAAEAWLRTALGGNSPVPLHVLHAWSEGASAEFVADLIRTGDPVASMHALSEHAPPFAQYLFTLRDERLFKDFTAEVPERVNRELAGYRSGYHDPGSLKRVAIAASYNSPTTMFDNLFPAVTNAASESAGWSGGGGGGGGGGFGGGGASRSPSGTSSRSYGRVRFSARVGGVVFGRSPESVGKAPDLVDLDWSFGSQDAISIRATMADGTKVVLGPYHPAVVHHALAYAADGRVVVSTLPMPFERPDHLTIPARRVVVHPAVEDTAFACRAIQVDRFVDAFTAGDTVDPSDSRERIASARSAVTYLGILLSPSAAKIDSREFEGMLANIADYARECEDDRACFPVADYESIGLDFGPAAKLIACLREADDAIVACSSLAKGGPAKNSYSVDSGVRERAYKIDPALHFVTGAGTKEALWPLEFIIQAVPQDSAGGDVNIAEGRDPWQFPTIAREVESVVAAGIAQDEGASDIFRDIRDFVAAQRFFRAALEGNLGDRFPLDSLVKLSRETRSYVKVQRNERWNVNRSFVDFLGQAQVATVKHLKEAQAAGLSGACGLAIADLLTYGGDRVWPPDARFWLSFGKLDGVCAAVYQVSGVIGLLRDLRDQEVIDEAIYLANEKKGASDRTRFPCQGL